MIVVEFVLVLSDHEDLFVLHLAQSTSGNSDNDSDRDRDRGIESE